MLSVHMFSEYSEKSGEFFSLSIQFYFLFPPLPSLATRLPQLLALILCQVLTLGECSTYIPLNSYSGLNCSFLFDVQGV